METTEIIQLITAISTTVIALAGIYVAYYYGYIPKQREEKIKQLQKELLDCYGDIYNLLEIEKDYMEEEGIGKITVRRGRNLSSRSQPANVENRIKELKNNLN